MKKLCILFVILFCAALVFANNLEGRVFAEKRLGGYKNTQYHFMDGKLYVCDMKHKDFTVYPYAIRGGLICLGEPGSDGHPFIEYKRIPYVFKDGTSKLELTVDGKIMKLVDVYWDIARTELKGEIVDNLAADTAIVASTSYAVAASMPQKTSTRNAGLKGMEHEITGVKFKKKTVTVGTKRIEGVFPKFESKFNAKLPKTLYEAPHRQIHFTECNKQLRQAVDSNPKIKSQFNSTQLEQIKNGWTPDGYVWHHSEEPGVMQLVDAAVHAKTGHTGGWYIWGGGSSNL